MQVISIIIISIENNTVTQFVNTKKMGGGDTIGEINNNMK